jgi:hypothetical protein
MDPSSYSQIKIATVPMIQAFLLLTIQYKQACHGFKVMRSLANCTIFLYIYILLLILILYLPRFNKPVALTGFGLVTQNNANDFVPFNSTQPPDAMAPFGPDPRMSNILSLDKMLIISSRVQPQPQRRLHLQLQPRRPLVSPIHKEMMPMPNGCKV